MASCTQIDNLLQASIDGQLSQAERVILEQHLGECPACRGLLKRHQRVSAQIFEAMADHALKNDLVKSVMENLPEMEHTVVDVAGLNWRTKHPSMFRERVRKWSPLAAAGLLVVLAFVLRENWPDTPIPADALGMVTYSSGVVNRFDRVDLTPSASGLESLVLPGDRFETGRDAQLLLSLLGETEMALNENTRVLITDERTLNVEEGEVHLTVGKGRQPFRVFTPTGKLTVFGTVFDVKVSHGRTVVVVEEGEVQVEHGGYQSLFLVAESGQQVIVQEGVQSLPRTAINPVVVLKWAKAIVPDVETHALFVSSILSGQRTIEAVGERVDYLVPTNGKPILSLVLKWDGMTSPRGGTYCAYDVFVYTPERESYFRTRLEPGVFSDTDQTSFEVKVDVDSRRFQYVTGRIVPDFSVGDREVEFTGFSLTQRDN